MSHNKTALKNNFTLIFAIGFAYFAFGAITNVAGAIVPKIRETYEVSSSMSTLLAAMFFIAYGTSSIPWGKFMEAKGKKTALMWSSLITTIGVLVFASIQGFYINMFAMFLCGIGVTGLQVILNPLVCKISDPSKYSRNLTLCLFINGIGSFLGPLVVTATTKLSLPWTATYWFFSAISLITIALVLKPKYPDEDETKTEDPEAKRSKDVSAIEMMKTKPLIFFFALGIFLYVGVEVGIANTIGFYLEDKLKIYETLGSDAESTKNLVISFYWGAQSIGRLIGSFVLDKIKSKHALCLYVALAAITLFLIIRNDLNFAIYAFPAIGFFTSIMFSTIYGLASSSFSKEYLNAISSILCTAIIGGAVIAPLIAKVSEISQGNLSVPNWDIGLSIAFVCYAYIFIVGLASKDEPVEIAKA